MKITELNLYVFLKNVAIFLWTLIVIFSAMIVTFICAITVFPFTKYQLPNNSFGTWDIWWAWRPVFIDENKFPYFTMFKNVRRRRDSESGIGHEYKLINNDN